MPPRPSRPTAAILALLATLLLATPVAAQTGPSEERDAAEEILQEAQRLSDGRGIRTGRELTVVLAQLAAARGDLSRADRAEADQLLARPTDRDDLDQTGGPYADSARVLRNCSADFCVHWVETTADAPPLTDANGCPTPDYVDHVRTALEQSHAVENTQLAWRQPVPDGTRGGNALTDVYLKQLNATDSGLYGYASTDGGTGRQRPAFMVLDNDYRESEFPQYGGQYTVPAEVTAAHEYNHVLQYAYDILQDPWMYESTATWAEEKVFPDDDDYHSYMDTWADNPGQPLTSPEGTKMYGSAIWNHWLEQRYGADVVERAWEQSVASGGFAPGAYDLAIAAEPEGTSFGENFGDFAAATAAWEGTDSGIRDGAQLDPLRVARGPALTIPTTERSVTLDHTAFGLFDVPVPADGSPPLTLSQSLPVGTTTGPAGTIALVGIEGGDVTKVVARTVNGSGTVTLADPGRFDGITAAVVNADVSEDGFDPPSNDWIWTRDNQEVEISLVQGAAAGTEPTDETDRSTPTTATSDPACGTTTVEREPIVATTTPTPTTSPTPTPSVTPPPPPPPLATSVRLSRNTTRIGTAARKGVLSLFARTNKAGRLTARGSVDATTAKRLKVGRRTTTVGTGRRTASVPGRFKINVRLTRKARAALSREKTRTLRIKVQVAFVPADGMRAVRRTLSVLLRP